MPGEPRSFSNGKDSVTTATDAPSASTGRPAKPAAPSHGDVHDSFFEDLPRPGIRKQHVSKGKHQQQIPGSPKQPNGSLKPDPNTSTNSSIPHSATSKGLSSTASVPAVGDPAAPPSSSEEVPPSSSPGQDAAAAEPPPASSAGLDAEKEALYARAMLEANKAEADECARRSGELTKVNKFPDGPESLKEGRSIVPVTCVALQMYMHSFYPCIQFQI